jgi:endonuclease/exonuclease/phosphatase family metal-dependent hydrolase
MLYTYLKRILKSNPEECLRTINHLTKLREQLDAEIPGKTAENTLLLATWNIRQFTDNREKESYMYIAEILSRFDLIAVQEVKEEMKGLKEVMDILGKNWAYIATDVSAEEDGGNGERIAFLYDTNKVSFKNIAGEIVLPHTEIIQGMQFARTPFCVSFQAGWFKFNLATVHIYYGKKTEDRKRREAEIKAIGGFLSGRAEKEQASYIILGDFNIPSVGDRYMKALEDSGFRIPQAIKKHPTNFGAEVKHYDQIAFNLKLEENIEVFDEVKVRSGAFDFTKSVYRDEDYQEYLPYMMKEVSVPNPDKPGKKMKVKVQRTGEEAQTYFHDTYRIDEMSDHMPLWLELKVDFSTQYIEKQKKETEKRIAELAAKAAAKAKAEAEAAKKG